MNAVGCEWDFNVPPDQVDLDRLWREWGILPAIAAYAYGEQLYKHAPKTYARIRDLRMAAGCTRLDWSYDPDGRFQ